MDFCAVDLFGVNQRGDSNSFDENMFEIFGIFFSIFQDEKPRRMRDELISLIGALVSQFVILGVNCV